MRHFTVGHLTMPQAGCTFPVIEIGDYVMVGTKSIKRLGTTLAGGLLAALLATPATASVITVDATIDLSKAELLVGAIEAGNYTYNAASLPLIAPVDISEGDTLNFKIRFANSQTLTIDGLE